MELPQQTPHSIATEMVLNAGIGIATYAGVLRLLHDAPLALFSQSVRLILLRSSFLQLGDEPQTVTFRIVADFT